MSDLVTSLTTGMGTMVTDALGAIGDIVPVVLPIMAAMIVIGVVLRVTSKIANRGK